MAEESSNEVTCCAKLSQDARTVRANSDAHLEAGEVGIQLGLALLRQPAELVGEEKKGQDNTLGTRAGTVCCDWR